MSDQPDKAAAAPAEVQPSDKTPAEPVANGQNATPAAENNNTTTTTAAAETPAATANDDVNNNNNNNSSSSSSNKEQASEQPGYLRNNPALSQFFDRLSTILKNADYNEMWGVALQESNTHVPTINVLIKYLRANEGSVKLAEDQLTNALKWRKTMNPVALAETGRYNSDKFAGLGYLTNYKDSNGKETVVTWNIYGAVKDVGSTFDDLDEFIRWRVALMELAVKDLKLGEATSVLDYDGEDPYQMVQVHDYLNVSFLRMNPKVKNSTKKTIEVFSMAYPEMLREKFFVNVPAVMGWMFTAVKVFLSKNTTRKFHPITNGANLAREFPSLVEQFPPAYGGKGAELQQSARSVDLDQKESGSAPEAAKEEPAKDAQEAPKEGPEQEPQELPANEPAKTETTETPAGK